MKKDVGFGDLFGRAWGIFKSKFVLLAGLAFVLSFLPNLIYGFWVDRRMINLLDSNVLPTAGEIYSEAVVGVPAVLVLSVLSILMTMSVIYLLNVKSKKVMNFGEVVKGGLNFLWAGILVSLLLFVFLMGNPSNAIIYYR